MKATKKLIGAFVALIAALAVSVGATFAWFTEQNSAKVNAFNLSVQDATGNLYIGLSEETLSQSPVTIDTSGSPYTNLKLTDVTLDATDHTLKRRSSNAPGTSADTGSLTTTTANTHYFQVQLYFKSDKAVDIYLDTGTDMKCTPNSDNDIIVSDTTAQGVITSDHSSYGGTITSGKLATSAKNAARVAFCESNTDLTNAHIWEPGKEEGYHTGNLAADYETYLKDGTWPASGSGAEESTVTGTIEGFGVSQESAKILSLTTPGKAESIYVIIWIEGTDGDCLNSIFADVLATNLNFIGKESGGD